MSDRNELEQLIEDMLCPGALLPEAEAQLERDDVGMLRCGYCHKPVLLRWGYVSLHGRERQLQEVK